MRRAGRVNSISYLKSDAAKIVKNLRASGEPLTITQNGEAKLVVQDVQSYEGTQQTRALLKILTLHRTRETQGRRREFLAELDELDREGGIG